MSEYGRWILTWHTHSTAQTTKLTSPRTTPQRFEQHWENTSSAAAASAVPHRDTLDPLPHPEKSYADACGLRRPLAVFCGRSLSLVVDDEDARGSFECVVGDGFALVYFQDAGCLREQPLEGAGNYRIKQAGQTLGGTPALLGIWTPRRSVSSLASGDGLVKGAVLDSEPSALDDWIAEARTTTQGPIFPSPVTAIPPRGGI
jgi:hypothetical protein